ncbi:Sec-independent protein translocase protein TatB [Novosphingobium sp. TH158]|uniref:Sec-independent protein translocase protein TatB n=1 Tax=Novosphingobium sp. TH158 TaxID=2067455 RepID=UPI000C7A749C|nr:Sec-independent protein translocase protein TatB [Novosphingobium sp. TH158]PLK25500.1 twin-arginine translocase subunit TatB [Novosphingobium sp. TH158]
MFDIGFDEMLLVAIVAIVVIGPKDLPMALRTVGRWVAKVRRVSGHFRAGVENMIREAELEEMEKKWREQNAAILAAHPDPGPDAEARAAAAAAEGDAAMLPLTPADKPASTDDATPELPLAPSR